MNGSAKQKEPPLGLTKITVLNTKLI